MRFIVSVPYSLLVEVEAHDAQDITDEMVEAALIDQHGKYAEVDVRDGGYNWSVIDTLDTKGAP